VTNLLLQRKIIQLVVLHILTTFSEHIAEELWSTLNQGASLNRLL